MKGLDDYLNTDPSMREEQERNKRIKANILGRIKNINENLISAGFSYDEIIEFWDDCQEEAKLQLRIKLYFS